MPSDDLSLADSATQRCPFPVYDEMRRQGPIYRDHRTGFYIVTDHALVRTLATDTASLSNNTGQITGRETPASKIIEKMFEEEAWPAIHTLVTNDPPSHRGYRTMVDRVFAPKRVTQMESYITEVADHAIDAVVESGEMEFVADVAMVVPIHIIADFLGLPRSDIAKIKAWSDATIGLINPIFDEQREIELNRQVVGLLRYLAECTDRLRLEPGESFLGALANASIDGRPLTMQEIVYIGQQFLVAGNETTTSALASGMLYLVRDPELQARLSADASLIPQFVEEILRLDAPIQGSFRRVTRDMTIAGVHLPEGAMVMLQWGAANRDSCKFADPDRIDLDRENSRAHMTFGSGPHFCIGNQLARAELRITFERVLGRMRNLRFPNGDGDIERVTQFFTYAPTKLRIAFDRA